MLPCASITTSVGAFSRPGVSPSPARTCQTRLVAGAGPEAAVDSVMLPTTALAGPLVALLEAGGAMAAATGWLAAGGAAVAGCASVAAAGGAVAAGSFDGPETPLATTSIASSTASTAAPPSPSALTDTRLG